MEKCIAIVLAAGSGKRMGTQVKKQYMELSGYPVLYHTLRVFQESDLIGGIVLVTGAEDMEYCRREIVDRYSFSKVEKIVSGGKERYNSVWKGLLAIDKCDYVFIHDGARAFVTEDILVRCLESVRVNRACVAAVRAKDTMKLENGKGFIERTINRDLLWTVQTPQVFEYELIRDCYERLLRDEEELAKRGIAITDDTLALELYSKVPCALVEGSYENIKLTTPEDIVNGESILRGRKG